MKILLRRNVSKLGKIGEVVDVKNGYARNYLLPQGLAVQPTKGNIAAVEAEKQRYVDYARATFRKDKRVNIRISSKNLDALKKKALEEGIPYQTLISSILHKYVNGRLVEGAE